MADETEQEPKTRTRQTGSNKSQQQSDEKSAAEARKAEQKEKADAKEKERAELKAKREAEAKERKEQQEKAKAEREEKRKAEKEAKEREREEAKAAKEQAKVQERQDKIDRGEIIFADDEGNLVEAGEVDSEWQGYTYALAEPKKEEVAQRARLVIQDLVDKAQEVPLPGKDLANEYGGGTVQWVSFFGMLRVLGMVKPYRFRTGMRGESGLAYLWVGPTDDAFLDSLSNGVADGEPIDEEAEVEAEVEPANA